MNAKRLLLALLFVPTVLLAQDSRGIAVKAVRATIGQGTVIPTYHAFIIGINDYEHWSKLRQDNTLYCRTTFSAESNVKM